MVTMSMKLPRGTHHKRIKLELYPRDLVPSILTLPKLYNFRNPARELRKPPTRRKEAVMGRTKGGENYPEQRSFSAKDGRE